MRNKLPEITVKHRWLPSYGQYVVCKNCGITVTKHAVRRGGWGECESVICPNCDGKGCDYYNLEAREKCVHGYLWKIY